MKRVNVGPAFIIIVFVVIGVLIIAASIYQDRKRMQFWVDLAQKWGFQYRAGDYHLICEKQEFPLTKQGHSRRIKHLIEGQVENRQMLLFDYTYKTGSGKHQSTHHLSVLMLEVPVTGHQLTIQAENFMHRIMGFLGFEDINFEYEEFNRAFQVRCDDKKFAYDVIHSDMMEYLMQDRTLAIEWSNNHILFYRSSHSTFDQYDAENIRQAALGFVRRLPSYMMDNSLEK